jgi:hypothetical protein
VRLTVGRHWPSGGHVAAVDEYRRIDGLEVPAGETIALFRAWLNWRTPASVVDAEIERAPPRARSP